MAGVNIVYITQTAADGTETQAVQQIELSYDDPSARSVVDLNGERRVDVSGTEQNAVLVNLADNTVDPVSLVSGVTATTLTNQQATDASGNSVTSLLSITLDVTKTSGDQTVTWSYAFDRDGASLDTPPSSFAPISFKPTPAPAAVQMLQEKMEGSQTFQALKSFDL